MTTEVARWQKEETLMIAKTYDRQTAKFLAVVGENMPELSGDVMQGWIQNPRGVQKVLREAFCPPNATSELKVWKTIKLGTDLKVVEDFRRVLKEAKRQISDWANDIMNKPAFAESLAKADPEEEYDLVLLTTAQLIGSKKGGTTSEVFAGAERLGLEKLPAWIGPKLGQVYLDQPNGEYVLIGMKPIADSDGYLGVFDVRRLDSDLWLSGDWGNPDDVEDPGFLWAFRLPRK